MKTINIFGLDVASLTLEETITEIEKYIIQKRKVQHVVINASKVVMMKKDLQLKAIIKSCPIINADGQSIVWAARFLGKRLPERVTGIDIMERLISESSKKSYKLYFFGAKQNVVKRLVEHYTELYPNIEIVGYRNGYFKESEELEIVNEINKSGADILFLGFSSPKKEYWLAKYNEHLDIPFRMGVGGSFDVITGVTKRAPIWMQKAGLEWFYRFLQEPKRMFKRYLFGNILFIVYTIMEKFKKETV
ncbi:WecB/TagA/CpsF family glycosyltransferase [Metabacillus niabensis]|uniref:WecB/TagA/CpsF family glycosyltransferase n=1 Tax=Metabacillus niabensis TaxID=324854 RepID=UPI0039A02680